ncbi:MAG TPA: hypothetical protein VK631_08450 [Solirubrobacteraceae bacterium]|nr:hypothetical protein [Solirubrobacteraceae bacterium]
MTGLLMWGLVIVAIVTMIWFGDLMAEIATVFSLVLILSKFL